MTNRQFFEFWGNFFTTMAQGQKQLEDMTAWMEQGFSTANEMSELFRRCYGLGPAKSDASREDKAWQNAVQDFQQSLTQMAAQWGWVSQSEHQKALDKCAALEKKIIQLQRTIKDLQDLLDREGSGHAKLFQHLKDAMEEQSDQFHTLMESIHIAYKDKS